MSLIDRASTFRGKVVDHAVGVSTNGWEQLECKLVATEIWDEEDQVWVNLADVELDANEIKAYIYLRGKSGDTLSHNQVKKVFNWNGTSLRELNDGNYSEVGIQFRVEEDTYQEKTQLKVAWIDEYDAVPGGSVRKLSPDKLKEIDAKYQAQRKTGKATPAKAPTAASGGKAGTITAKGIKPTSPKGPVKKAEKKTATEAVAAVPNTPPDEVEAKPATAVGSCTKQEAYDEIVATKDKKVADEKVAVAWGNAIRTVGRGKKVDDLTDEEWFQVKVTVQDEVGEIPF